MPRTGRFRDTQGPQEWEEWSSLERPADSMIQCQRRFCLSGPNFNFKRHDMINLVEVRSSVPKLYQFWPEETILRIMAAKAFGRWKEFSGSLGALLTALRVCFAQDHPVPPPSRLRFFRPIPQKEFQNTPCPDGPVSDCVCVCVCTSEHCECKYKHVWLCYAWLCECARVSRCGMWLCVWLCVWSVILCLLPGFCFWVRGSKEEITISSQSEPSYVKRASFSIALLRLGHVRCFSCSPNLRNVTKIHQVHCFVNLSSLCAIPTVPARAVEEKYLLCVSVVVYLL